MARKLAIGAAAMAILVLGAAPVSAMPKALFYVDVDCPSGSQTLGFIDNEGSIVGFDEGGNVVQFHKLDGEFSVVAEVEGEVVFSANESFAEQIGKGKGLKLEQCEFAAVFADLTETVTEDLAALFEELYGTDVLYDYLGAEVHILSQISGDVWLKFPGR